ncbi:5-carboxymethyl-2-hydroxymuconate delta-isomerase [Halorubrum distributum JCM 13916]|uniref:5-carboxymethyl-2-hydroxymuconate delta-isomerase n=1 Tax=Halorubrum distributum JCM 13916 TaxID=1230455 RepID=M0PLD9_9EURY|nr:5-carboxymethyl-2-hydroxymuconate delta-isomerase [Halorubrum arcis JCM 13916]
MRIGQYRTTDEQTPWPGVATDDGVVDLAEAGAAAGVHVPDRTSDLLADWEWRRKADLAVEHAAETGVGVRDPAALERAAPVDDPQKVVCVALLKMRYGSGIIVFW